MPVTTPLIDIESAQRELASTSEGVSWLLTQIESQQGHFQFPPWITKLIEDLQLGSYPLLYAHENGLEQFMLHTLMSPAERHEFQLRVERSSPDERGQIVRELDLLYGQIDLRASIPRTAADSERIRQCWASLGPAECQRQFQLHQVMWAALLVSLFDSLSMMVHGVKLTRLVTWAIAGDDTAYVKAVQIDKRILFTVPYFIERFNRAAVEGPSSLVENIGRRMAEPPYKGKIQHKALWLAFSYLDAAGLLDGKPHKVLLNLCVNAKVLPAGDPLDDVANFSKRLSAYRRFQEGGGAHMP